MNAPVAPPRHGLWSLWDIMTPFPISKFLIISHITGHWYPYYMKMGGHTSGKWKLGEVIRDDDRELFDRMYEDIEGMCAQLELNASIATVRRMRICLADGKSKYRELFHFGEELHSRLSDEMREKRMFALTLKEAEYFSEPLNGWEEIVELFPESITDIEETSKCFALSRYPAAVFHSLQVVEIGLIALGKEIGVVDPLSGWTAVTGRLHAILKTKFPDRSASEQKHSAFLEQMVGTVEGLKNAWRNKVSHAHGRLALMTADFSPEIAEEILFATRAFMRRLATDGPLAETEPHG